MSRGEIDPLERLRETIRALERGDAAPGSRQYQLESESGLTDQVRFSGRSPTVSHVVRDATPLADQHIDLLSPPNCN